LNLAKKEGQCPAGAERHENAESGQKRCSQEVQISNRAITLQCIAMSCLYKMCLCKEEQLVTVYRETTIGKITIILHTTMQARTTATHGFGFGFSRLLLVKYSNKT